LIGRRSISVRLTVWFSAVFFAGLTLFGAFMWLCLDHTLTAGRSHTLERRAVRLAQLLEETRHDLPAERIRRFDAFADATGGGMVEIFRPDGTRALPSPTEASRAFPWPGISTLDRDRFVETVFQAQTYRVLLRPLTSVSPPLILCVAAPLEGNRLVMNAFSAGLAWTIPALLALSALGGYLLSRRALRPVDQITAAARSISVSNLSGRLPVPETHDELQRLSETCNQMLARLEAAVNEIKRFTGDASHELRNPVSFVRTTAELALRNRRIDDASRRAFEEIVEECGKANGLLKDMLTLARADAGNSPLAFEAVDLVEVVRALSPKARLLAEECGHTFAISIDGTACATVCGDYPSLHRLLWILLDNAAKYTPAPGWIRIAVSAAGDRAIVTVEDNGIGISEADLPHIFERFYRADPSRGRVEGSGLGLAIALWIANVHQASLSVSSKQGAGSVFRVVFPLLSAGAKRPKASAAPHLLTTAG
jgi:heavy metal sensor kinase